jgi:hypothetical protein
VFAISELLVLQSLVVAARVYEYSVHGALAKEQEAETWCMCYRLGYHGPPDLTLDVQGRG